MTDEYIMSNILKCADDAQIFRRVWSNESINKLKEDFKILR